MQKSLSTKRKIIANECHTFPECSSQSLPFLREKNCRAAELSQDLQQKHRIQDVPITEAPSGEDQEEAVHSAHTDSNPLL